MKEPTKKELLAQYAKREPRTFLLVEGKMTGFSNSSNSEFALLFNLRHALLEGYPVQLYVSQEIGTADVVGLLREMADTIQETGLPALYDHLIKGQKEKSIESPNV
jgi:hypothetical protein